MCQDYPSPVLALSQPHPSPILAPSQPHPSPVLAPSQPHPSRILASSQPHPNHILASSQPHPSHILAASQPHPSPILVTSQSHPSHILATSQPHHSHILANPIIQVVSMHQRLLGCARVFKKVKRKHLIFDERVRLGQSILGNVILKDPTLKNVLKKLMWFFQNVKKHYEKKMFYIFGKKKQKRKTKIKRKN